MTRSDSWCKTRIPVDLLKIKNKNKSMLYSCALYALYIFEIEYEYI